MEEYIKRVREGGLTERDSLVEEKMRELGFDALSDNPSEEDYKKACRGLIICCMKQGWTIDMGEFGCMAECFVNDIIGLRANDNCGENGERSYYFKLEEFKPFYANPKGKYIVS